MKATKKTEPQKKQLRKLNEKEVTKGVLQWAGLRAKTVRLFRMQTTGIPDGRGGLRTNNEKGAPDFIGAYLMAKIPVLFAFEIKSPTGKQSEAQKNWQQRAEEFGIHYFIIKSWEEAESAIQTLHQKHRRKISWGFLGNKFPEHKGLEKKLWTELKSSTGEVKRTVKPSNIPDPKNKKHPDKIQDSPRG